MRILLFVFFVLSLSAYALEKNVFSAGLEVCHMKRMREGGTQQNGRMDGMRVSYDRLKAASWYLGLDHFNGKARMYGHTGSQKPIFSTIRDTSTEARLGFTFQTKGENSPFCTLFSGYGVFKETNRFSDPTPLPLTFTERFGYIPAGFLSGIHLTSLLSLGVNYKMMFMLEGTSKVTDDPGRDNVTLKMNDEVNVRLELPVQIAPKFSNVDILFSCVPFAEFRHFGGREGFPYNFIDTKFNLFGLRVSLVSSY